MATKNTNTTKTTKKNIKSAKKSPVKYFLDRVNSLTEGKSVSRPEFGTVTCLKSAKTSGTGHRLFAMKGSTIVRNSRKYNFTSLRRAFGDIMD